MTNYIYKKKKISDFSIDPKYVFNVKEKSLLGTGLPFSRNLVDKKANFEEDKEYGNLRLNKTDNFSSKRRNPSNDFLKLKKNDNFSKTFDEKDKYRNLNKYNNYNYLSNLSNSKKDILSTSPKDKQNSVIIAKSYKTDSENEYNNISKSKQSNNQPNDDIRIINNASEIKDISVYRGNTNQINKNPNQNSICDELTTLDYYNFEIVDNSTSLFIDKEDKNKDKTKDTIIDNNRDISNDERNVDNYIIKSTIFTNESNENIEDKQKSNENSYHSDNSNKQIINDNKVNKKRHSLFSNNNNNYNIDNNYKTNTTDDINKNISNIKQSKHNTDSFYNSTSYDKHNNPCHPNRPINSGKSIRSLHNDDYLSNQNLEKDDRELDKSNEHKEINIETKSNPRINKIKTELKRGMSNNENNKLLIEKKSKGRMKELFKMSSLQVENISTKFIEGKKIDNSNILKGYVDDISKKKESKDLANQLNKIIDLSQKFIVSRNDKSLLSKFKSLLKSEKNKLVRSEHHDENDGSGTVSGNLEDGYYNYSSSS